MSHVGLLNHCFQKMVAWIQLYACQSQIHKNSSFCLFACNSIHLHKTQQWNFALFIFHFLPCCCDCCCLFYRLRTFLLVYRAGWATFSVAMTTRLSLQIKLQYFARWQKPFKENEKLINIMPSVERKIKRLKVCWNQQKKRTDWRGLTELWRISCSLDEKMMAFLCTFSENVNYSVTL